MWPTCTVHPLWSAFAMDCKTAPALPSSPSSNSETKSSNVWWEMSDAQLWEHLLSHVHNKPLDLHLFEIEQLMGKMKQSYEIIERVFDEYKCVSLSYNGGKDSVALLNLVQWVLHRRYGTSLSHKGEDEEVGPKTALVFHICEKNNFQEIEHFIRDSEQRYGMHTVLLDGSHGFKAALVELCEKFPNVDAVFMGVRKSDPGGSDQGFFERTSANWPQMMRVNPLLLWDYRDVWAFLTTLSIPYCQLYDMGYTSLGCVHNTQKNPYLLQSDTSYLPAYMLKDGSKERESRMAHKSC